jgi:putative tricarboxylic transport membrane protein
MEIDHGEMQWARYRDLLAGVVCVAGGSGVLFEARKYTIGSLDSLGLGFYPAILGALLVLVGLAIVATALTTMPPPDETSADFAGGPDWRGWSCIVGGVCSFRLSARHQHAAVAMALGGMSTALTDLWHGFAVALLPANLVWCFVGVLVGNLVGVLPGLGVLSTVSILLPLTFGMKPVAAILMLAGIYYGAQYGGAICSIPLNLPCHPPHPVTCLDGYPLTRQGKGGTALGITIIAACMGASFGIVEMTFFAPVVARFALDFGPADICSLMLLGLLAGSTLARGSPLKGVAMTLFGQVLGLAGVDMNTGAPRFTFGFLNLYDGVELVALALGLFGIAEFLKSVNRIAPLHVPSMSLRLRDLLPSRSELRTATLPMVGGTLVGSLCAMVPGTGPTIASFVAYALEKKLSHTPARFGTGMIAGVAAPEASTHSLVQGDFIPTMTWAFLAIPAWRCCWVR